MATETQPREVQYAGYDPQSDTTLFRIPARWGTGIPIPNARLIDAAPELLGTLKVCTQRLEDSRPPTAGVSAQAIDQARAAIAKAEA